MNRRGDEQSSNFVVVSDDDSSEEELYNQQKQLLNKADSNSCITQYDTQQQTTDHKSYMSVSTDSLSNFTQENSRMILRRVVFVTLICLQLTIAFPLHYPDLINIPVVHVSLQRALYIILLLTTMVSTMLAPFLTRYLSPKCLVIVACSSVCVFNLLRCFSFDELLVCSAAFVGLLLGPIYVINWRQLLRYSHMIEREQSHTEGSTRDNLVMTSLNVGMIMSGPLISAGLAATILLDTSSKHAINATADCGPYLCLSSDMNILLLTSSDFHAQPRKVYIDVLLACYFVFALGALLVGIFLFDDKFKTTNKDEGLVESIRGHFSLLADQCSPTEFILLLLYVTFVGNQQMFAYLVYLQGFVTCEVGHDLSLFVGMVMAAVYLTFCLPIGWLCYRLGQAAVLLVSNVLLLFVLIFLATWTSNIPVWLLFIFGVLWSLSDCTLNIVLYGFINLRFSSSSEIAFSVTRICQLTGQLMMFLFYVYGVCVDILLYILIGYILIASASFITLLVRMKLMERESSSGSRYQYCLLPRSGNVSWIPRMSALPQPTSDVSPIYSKSTTMASSTRKNS